MDNLLKFRHIIFPILIFILCIQSVWARELTLESFQLLPQDISARTNMREDYNGDKCALVKISLPIEGCRFEGGVVNTEYDVNEYHVHVVAGTKRMRIKCPGFDTFDVVFSEHSDVKSLESLATYSLRVGGYEAMVGKEAKDPGVNYLIMYIDPEDIPGLTVTINGEVREVEDGEIALCLPYGSYSYLIEAPGYRSVKGKVDVTRGEKGTVGISLQPTETPPAETLAVATQVPDPGNTGNLIPDRQSATLQESTPSSANAILTVRSELPGVRIRVNQRDRGNDKWSGPLEPGTYVIDATKEGYHPFSETITITSNEMKEFTIPELIPIFGGIDVSYRPAGATIIIDGNIMGETPEIVNNVPAGYHTVTISKKGYNTIVWSNVLVEEGEIFQLKGALEKSAVVFIEEDYTPPSYRGGLDAMWEFMQKRLKIPAGTPSGRHKIPFEFSLDEKGKILKVDVTQSVNEIRNLEEECKKLFKKMPPFNPALRAGTPEKAVYTITIPIIVNNDNKIDNGELIKKISSSFTPYSHTPYF